MRDGNWQTTVGRGLKGHTIGILGLGKQEMYMHSVKCIDYIFSDDTTKQVLRTQMQKIKNETLNE